MSHTIRLLGISAAAGMLALSLPAPSAMAISAPLAPTTVNAAVPAAGVHGGTSNGAPYVRVIRSNASGHCLDDSSVIGLRLFPCNNLVYQRFDVYNNPNGTRYLVSRATGRCVEDAPNGIRAANCNGAANQMWYFSNWGTGGTGISNRSTGRCVYAYAAARNVHVLGTARCNWSSRAQSFSLQ